MIVIISLCQQMLCGCSEVSKISIHESERLKVNCRQTAVTWGDAANCAIELDEVNNNP